MKKKKYIFIALSVLLLLTGCDFFGKKNKRTYPKTTKSYNTQYKPKQSTSEKRSTGINTNQTTYAHNNYKKYYVSTKGRENNTGTSFIDSITLSKALGLIKTGDEIYLEKGVYNVSNDLIINISGSEVKHNMLVGMDDVTINFEGVSEGLRIDASYWDISNIEIINSKSYGWSVNGKEISITNCRANNNSIGGFGILDQSSDVKLTSCEADFNYLAGYSGASGFFVTSKGTNIVLDSCVAYRNQNCGFVINAVKKATLTNCLAYENGINKDSSINTVEGERSGFLFNDNDHYAYNCIAFNNVKYGFGTSDTASCTLKQCSSYNNHLRNYNLRSTSANDSKIIVENILSYNTYDENNDGIFDSTNDYVIAEVKKSIICYDSGYLYIDNERFSSLDLTKSKIDLTKYIDEEAFTINLKEPDNIINYDEYDIPKTVNCFVDGKIKLNNYLDRAIMFQNAFFEYDSSQNNEYIGADLA